ncbi:MAG: ATP-binding protein, partial [Candidatus Angelobacter sp.]
RIPPFSIQTLVENSIKHAIAPLRVGGNVRITVEPAGDTLAIRVSDSGPGFSMDDIPTGHGLSNLQGRLAHIFEGRAKLTAFSDNGRATTQVTIPRSAAHARISG